MFTPGTSWIGGPFTTDAWGAKAAPSPSRLIENFKSIAYCCAVRNADAVSAVPLRLYMDSTGGKRPKDISDPRSITRRQFEHLQTIRGVGGGSTRVSDIQEIRNHPFLSMLDEPDPNGDFDRASLLKLIVLYMDVVGRAYFYPERPGNWSANMPPRWMWPLYSQYVYPIRNANNSVVGEYQYYGETLGRDEVLCFGHNLSLKDPYGAAFSPLYAAVEYARLEDKFVSIQEQLLAMGPRPNLIGTPKDPNNAPGPNEKDRFELDLNRKYARAAQGGILLTTGAWDFMPLTYAPTDLAGLKIAEYDWQAICGAFGVPYVFFTTDTNLANLSAAFKHHAIHGVQPRCTTIANRLTWFIRRFDPRLFFAFDNPVKEDRELEAKIIDMAVKNGTMTINQANADNGLPPVEWGDEPWLQNTMSQPSKIRELNDATIAAATLAASGANEGGGSAAVGNKDAEKPKGGKSEGKKSDDRSFRDDDPGDPGVGRGVLDQGDASVHGVEGLTEGEDGDPFGWLSWSVDPPSGRSD
jgi:HK97 family phage portal protein